MQTRTPLFFVVLILGVATSLLAAEEQTKTTFHMRPISTCKGHDKETVSPKELPLIAIMAGSTTRNVKSPDTNTIALFTVLLPSLLRSLDCGFRYVYMLGFDAGDSFYDSDEGMLKVKSWFSEEITKVLKENGIEMSLKPVRVVNDMKKPGEMNTFTFYFKIIFFFLNFYPKALFSILWLEQRITWDQIIIIA
jgi:hypothetical protein